MDLVGEATGSRSSRFHGLSARLFPCMTTMLAVLAIGAVFWLGLQRGMDRVLSFGPQSEENAIAIAISELVYGVDGYLTHYKVLEALQEAVHRGTDGAHDPKLELNVRNGALINEGISAATSLGPLPLAQVVVADGGLRTMVYDDVGIVDFVKVAFVTFGFGDRITLLSVFRGAAAEHGGFCAAVLEQAVCSDTLGLHRLGVPN